MKMKHHIKENDRVFYEETEDILDELHEINSLPGEPMSMEEIRKNRQNKETPAW